MDIGFYIADILRKQDKVSVPGLGTFARIKVPGSYDHSSNSFRPPSYDVSFIKDVDESESLSDYIRAKKNLSSSSAEYFIKKFTDGISDILERSGVAELNPLGIFRQRNETLTFDKSPDFEIGGKFYGLKPVHDLRSPIQAAVQEFSPAPVHQGGTIEDFITGQGSDEEFDDEIEEDENFVEVKGKKSILLITLGAFIFIVSAMVLFYLFNPATKNLVDRMLPGYISNTPAQPDLAPVRKSVPIEKQDTINIVPPSVAQDSSMIDSVATAMPVVNEPEPVTQVMKIEIIGATFGKRSEAEAYVQTMKKRGIQAKIADDMPGKLFKVSLASFPDDESAQAELNRIVREVEKTAWIAKYKSKKTQ